MFTIVIELKGAIDTDVQKHDHNPKHFMCAAKADDVPQNVIRADSRLSSKKGDTNARVIRLKPGGPVFKLQENLGNPIKYLIETGDASGQSMDGYFSGNRYEKS